MSADADASAPEADAADWAPLIGDAYAANDFWGLMTIATLPLLDPADARVAIECIVERLGGIASARVADLGSGTGRYAQQLASHSPQALVAIEQSPVVCAISRTLHPDITVWTDTYTNLGRYGSFEVVFALSHLLFMQPSPEGFVSDLRAIRSTMDEGGILVLERMIMGEDDREWSGNGVHVVERVSNGGTRPATLNHSFAVDLQDDRPALSATVHSLAQPLDWLEAAMTRGGFVLEERFLGTDSDGDTEFLILRAAADFNYLSDLEEFLDAWVDPTHERNWGTLELARDGDGRVRRDADDAVPSRGAALTIHSPAFVESLEDGIAPLALALIDRWNVVTYSSCEGHDVDGTVPEMAYVGMVAFDETYATGLLTRLQHLADAMADSADAVRVQIRRRPLCGSRIETEAIDLCLVPTVACEATEDFRHARGGAVRRLTELIEAEDD